VVIEAVFFVPQPERVHRRGDLDEVLPELARHVLVIIFFKSELERDAEHVEAIHRHPARAVRLLEVAAAGQRRAAIEHSDVVEPEKAALEDVAPLGVLAIHPPGEVDQQFVEYAPEELAIADAAALLLDLVDAPRRPGEHRWIDVAK